MDHAERIVSISESKRESGPAGDAVDSNGGVVMAERMVRKSRLDENDTEYDKPVVSREHNLSNSNAILSAALLSSGPKKLVGEISLKTKQLLRELAVISIQRVARGYICRRTLKISRLVSIIKDQMSSSFTVGIVEEVVLQHAFEIATAQVQDTETAREVSNLKEPPKYFKYIIACYLTLFCS